MLIGWSEKVFIFCISVTAVVEAGQQGLKDAPVLAALVPSAIRGSFWNYVPAVFLLGGCAFWAVGHFLPRRSQLKSRAEIRADWSNPRLEMVSGKNYVNKTVDIDGKSFRDCSFEHVTLMFHGTAPSEMVGTNQISGGLSIDIDHPMAMFYSKMQRFARSIPGARVLEGSVDAHGNVLPDK